MNRTLARAWLLSFCLHGLFLVLLLTLLSPDAHPPVDALIQVRLWQVPLQRPLLRRAPLPVRAASPTSAASPFVPLTDPGITTVTLPLSSVTVRLPFGELPSRIEDSLIHTEGNVSAPKQIVPPRRTLRRSALEGHVRVTRPQPTLRFQSIVPEPLELPLSPLEQIALDVVHEEQERVDLLFLIDASQSMEDDIRAVARLLDGLIFRLEQGGVDARLGVLAFRHGRFFSMMGWDTEFQPFTRDFERVKRMIGNIECVGGERALDAILIALDRAEFRQDASRRVLLVTDEYLSGNAQRSEVLRAIRQKRIKLDVIGRDEPFQRYLAKVSHGVWQPIEALDR